MSLDPKSPRTPSPRVLDDGGVARILPAHEAMNVDPETLAGYQKDALTTIEDLRQRILDGEIIGLSYACVSAVDGEACAGSGYTSGFLGFGLTGMAALNIIHHRFVRDFHNITYE